MKPGDFHIALLNDGLSLGNLDLSPSNLFGGLLDELLLVLDHPLDLAVVALDLVPFVDATQRVFGL
jgi:hypothetical protein